MKIGKNLKKLREARGLSLRGLFKEVGINHVTLAAYETDKIQPTIGSYFKLVEFFEVPFEYLVTGEKAKGDYKDVELRKLFDVIERMGTEDRKTVKGFLKRFIKAKATLKEIKQEMDSL